MLGNCFRAGRPPGVNWLFLIALMCPSFVCTRLPPILQEKVIAERERALLKEQELYNRLRNKDYGPAIALALELKRPQKLWGVLRDAMTEGIGEGAPGADEGERVLRSVIYVDHPKGFWRVVGVYTSCAAYGAKEHGKRSFAALYFTRVVVVQPCIALVRYPSFIFAPPSEDHENLEHFHLPSPDIYTASGVK